MSTYWFRIEQT